MDNLEKIKKNIENIKYVQMINVVAHQTIVIPFLPHFQEVMNFLIIIIL